MADLISGPGAPRIPKFYEGRSIFITGASGFVGKVLVERLLSTCPDIKKIYLLLRQKNNVAPEKRFAELLNSQVFEILRRKDPQQLDKLEMVVGDVTRIDLGICAHDLMKLKEVSIVFHSAATVKFQEPLRSAVDQNLRSVMRVMELCDQLPNLQVAVQVSTAYSNSEHRRVEERVYPAPVQPHQVLNLMETSTDRQLAVITREYIHPKPNTYTFTKALAETFLAERSGGHYSIAIYRPSIVICTAQWPFPGWTESLQGAGLVIAAAGSGLMRASAAGRNMRADMVPADMCADGLIAVAWETALIRSKEVRVYNCTSVENVPTWRFFRDTINKAMRDNPLNNAVWYPRITACNQYEFPIADFFTQKLPLYSTEYLKRILGVKTKINFIHCYKKFCTINEVLSHFSLNDWDFDCDNLRQLREKMCKEDRMMYNLDPRTIDWTELITIFVKGVKKYALKEKDEDLPKARRRMNRLRILYYCTTIFFIIITIRLTFISTIISNFVLQLLR